MDAAELRPLLNRPHDNGLDAYNRDLKRRQLLEDEAAGLPTLLSDEPDVAMPAASPAPPGAETTWPVPEPAPTPANDDLLRAGPKESQVHPTAKRAPAIREDDIDVGIDPISRSSTDPTDPMPNAQGAQDFIAYTPSGIFNCYTPSGIFNCYTPSGIFNYTPSSIFTVHTPLGNDRRSGDPGW